MVDLQIRDIQIPLRSGNLNSIDLLEADNEEADIEIDYSNLPDAYKDREMIKENEEYLKNEIDTIQRYLDHIELPNKKVYSLLILKVFFGDIEIYSRIL